MKIIKWIWIFVITISLTQFSYAYQQYGMCTQEAVAVRKTTNSKSEQVTQLMFGDGYKVIKYSADKKWVYIQNAFDKYEGWIRKFEYFETTEWFYSQVNKKNFPICADLKATVVWRNKKITISFGSTLPFYKDGKIRIGTEDAVYEGSMLTLPKKLDKEKVIRNAYKFLKTPYLWGGKSRKGVDCSGFTQVVYKSAGYRLPRDSYQQAERGKTISLSEAQAGDLAFFQRNGKVVHVGIVLGNGKIIHANDAVQIDKLDQKGIYNERKKAYSHYLKFIKRID